jgi:hypothetical protein
MKFFKKTILLLILNITILSNAKAQVGKALSDDSMFHCAYISAFFTGVWKNPKDPQEKQLHQEALIVHEAYKKFATQYITKRKLTSAQVNGVADANLSLPFETKLNMYLVCRANPNLKPYL